MYLGVIACCRTMETECWSSRIQLDSFQIDEMRFAQHPAEQVVGDESIFNFLRVKVYERIVIRNCPLSSHLYCPTYL